MNLSGAAEFPLVLSVLETVVYSDCEMVFVNKLVVR